MTKFVAEWAEINMSERLGEIRSGGENSKIEFKENVPEQAYRLAKEIAAFATSGGGEILIGISGDLVGLDVDNQTKRDKLFEHIHGIINSVKPTPRFNLCYAVEQSKTVLVIQINEQEKPIFYYDHKSYVRDNRRSRPAEPDEVQDLVWKHPSSEYRRKQ